MSKKSTRFIDIDGVPHEISWDTVFESVERLSNYFDAVGDIFFEREDVLEKLKLAMMLREHLLLIGPTGTGKTALFNKALSGIDNANYWSMNLNKFTGDTHLFGSYDQRELERTGRMMHMTEGSLAEANFAHLGEFFDASDPTLRTLLGALNERRVKRGPQVIECPILTAIADTNFRPEDMPARASQLAAVVDRFLFKSEIDYIQSAQNDFDMHSAFLTGDFDKKLPPLSINDVIVVSGIVINSSPNLLENKYVLEAYIELRRGISEDRVKEGRPPISDRRSIRAAQIIEAQALLSGRVDAVFDDLWSVKNVLSSCLEDLPIIQRRAEETIKKWSSKSARNEIEIELEKIRQIVDSVTIDVDHKSLTTAELLEYKSDVDTLEEALKSFEASTLEGKTMIRESMISIIDARENADFALIDIAKQALDIDPAAIEREDIAATFDVVLEAKKLLSDIPANSTRIFAYHAEAVDKISLLTEILQKRAAHEEVEDLLRAWNGV